MKYKILGISDDSVPDYIYNKVVNFIGAEVIEYMNKYGEEYKHQVPWDNRYIENMRKAIYLITKGSIGRINTVLDAVCVGVYAKSSIPARCFTSKALYYVYKIARFEKYEVGYVKQLEEYIDRATSGGAVNHKTMRYVSYFRSRG